VRFKVQWSSNLSSYFPFLSPFARNVRLVTTTQRCPQMEKNWSASSALHLGYIFALWRFRSHCPPNFVCLWIHSSSRLRTMCRSNPERLAMRNKVEFWPNMSRNHLRHKESRHREWHHPYDHRRNCIHRLLEPARIRLDFVRRSCRQSQPPQHLLVP